MSDNAFLDQSVDLALLAEETNNFSGAELEGLVKDATAYALNRNINSEDMYAPLEEENLKVLCPPARQGWHRIRITPKSTPLDR